MEVNVRNKHKITLGLIILFSCSLINFTFGLTPQSFKLYSDSDIQNFTNNFVDFTHVGNSSRYSYLDFLCSERGAWIGFKYPEYVNDPLTPNAKNTAQLNRQSILPSCQHFSGNLNPKTIAQFRLLTSWSRPKSVRHIGHSDLERPALSLYEFKHFGGAEFYFDGIHLVLPRPIRVQSYGYTGSETWTLIERMDLSGQSRICLDGNGHNMTNSVIDTVTVEGSVDFLNVGSIQRGCSRVGTVAQNSLTLHSPSGFGLFMDGFELRLPFALSFRSFVIIGGESWTIFEGNELNGSSHCLHPFGMMEYALRLKRENNYYSYGKPNEDPNQIYQIYAKETERFNEVLMIGSIRRGCSPKGSYRSQLPTNSSPKNMRLKYSHGILIVIFGLLLLW